MTLREFSIVDAEYSQRDAVSKQLMVFVAPLASSPRQESYYPIQISEWLLQN
jgi:hypothetical protein